MGLVRVLVLVLFLQLFLLYSCVASRISNKHIYTEGKKQTRDWRKPNNFVSPFNTKILKCGPQCEPECGDKGECVAPGVCVCQKGFKGPNCDVVDVCNSRHTGFEKVGTITCKDYPDRNVTQCTMKCFENGELQGPRESECDYETGEFYPPIGTCTYDEQEQEPKELVPKEIEPPIYQLSTNDNAPPREAAMCAIWSGTNVKTFDGAMFKAPLSCSYTLIADQRDLKNQLFGVVIQTCPFGSAPNCSLSIHFYYEGTIYFLRRNPGNAVQFSSKYQTDVVIPHKVGNKVWVQPIGKDIQIKFPNAKITIIWDTHQYIQVLANKKDYEMRLGGICGNLNGNPRDDLIGPKAKQLETVKEFVDSWRVHEMDESPQNQCLGEDSCEVKLKYSKGCPDQEKAQKICEQVFFRKNTEDCVKIFELESWMSACIDDYCNCRNRDDPQNCVCETMDMLARQCKFYGIKTKRDKQYCKIECEAPLVWRCGTTEEPMCGLPATKADPNQCEEGCYCPENKIRHKGGCIDPKDCPCIKGVTEYPKGSQVKHNCNTCTCNTGSWDCTTNNCTRRFGAWGDPHYTTFDGKRFDFMGKGLFYLVMADDIQIIGENSFCINDHVSCISALIVIANLDGTNQTIKLLQEKEVDVNGKRLTKYPYSVQQDRIIIKRPIGSFLSLTYDKGINILWDGVMNFYIDVSGEFYNRTYGLGGTINDNMDDDFTTRDGYIEASAHAFGNKWKVDNTNDNIQSDDPDPGMTIDYPNDEGVEDYHPCDNNEHMVELSQRLCHLMEGDIFLDCHDSVDPGPFIDSCLFDGCACGDNVTECYCPAFSAYADECSRQGTLVRWRQNIEGCGIQCPRGMVYTECGDACTQTCFDLLEVGDGTCTWPCIAGCRCPEGQYLTPNSTCVPQEECPCKLEKIIFDSGYKEVRLRGDAQELCTCKGGTWKCEPPKAGDQEKYPSFLEEARKNCSQKPLTAFALCAPEEPITCKNMKNYVKDLNNCEPGCICTEGHVYDDTLKACVKPEDCSCHHSGKSFSKDDQINVDCSICKCCSAGEWKCTPNKCEATCSVWGNSHFTTFDKLDFDFQGECNYILSRGVAQNGDSFLIAIQNQICSAIGVTCSKSMKVELNGSTTDVITLSSGDQPFENLLEQLANKRNVYNIYKAGVFIVLEILPLRVQIKCDEGTRFHVTLGSRWAGKVDGLCGNFNRNSIDDIQTNPLDFGHSWKLNTCAMPTLPNDTCKAHPERENWARTKCNIIMTPLFQACHQVVPVEKYLERCIFDTCACNGCECLCTAISAYAHACSMQGIHIRWRTQDLCPLQCGQRWAQYEVCTPACGPDTCDNFHNRENTDRLCLEENCLEGCLPKPCDEGMVFSNASMTQCVPKSVCQPICMEKYGKVFSEGDVTVADDCQTCICTNKEEVCTYKPCTSTKPVAPVCPEGMKTTITGHLITRSMSEIFSLPNFRSNEIPGSKNQIKAIDLPLPKLEGNQNHVEHYAEYYCTPHSKTTVAEKCPEKYNLIQTPAMKPGEFACSLRKYKDYVCELSGTFITTFDSSEVRYEVCNHILARSLVNSSWHISVHSKCKNNICHKELLIKDVISNTLLTIRSNLEVQINGVIQSPESLKQQPLTTESGFFISQPGDSILVVRPLHGFWVLYDKLGQIKIGVSEKFIRTIDGLCGYFSGTKGDDLRGPGGIQAGNAMEFGKSWADKDLQRDECQPQEYKEHNIKLSQDICHTIEHPSFQRCSETVNAKQFITKCIEITSQCLSVNGGDTKLCKCSVLQDFVAQCLVMNPNIQLDTTWRTSHNCEVSCPWPMVYSDCNKRRCVPTCDKLYAQDCTKLSEACFSGCFCPEGTLRNGDSCTPINECKDCLCQVSERLQYDKKNFTSYGKCTYLLSNDMVLPEEHTFKVFATNDYCRTLRLSSIGNMATCAKSLHILYGDHKVHIQRMPWGLLVLIDGIELVQLPFKDTWLEIMETMKNGLRLTLPKAHIEVTGSFDDITFEIQRPSALTKLPRNKDYNCDDCNGPQKHALECLKEDVLLQPDNCIVLPPEKDLCLKLLDDKLFGSCHKLVNASAYVAKCQREMCEASQKGICNSLSRYAKECNRRGICVDWRSANLCPVKCPAHLEYRPCGCLRTCATIKAGFGAPRGLVNNNLDCGAAKTEGCFCPANKVFDNDVCIDEVQCIKCFDGIHSVGETWKKDKCTECTCNNATKTECVEKHCPVVDNICSVGFTPSIVNSKDDCCPKYICVQEVKTPKPVKCPEPLQPVCAPDQVKTQVVGSQGCPHFICECKPQAECQLSPELIPLKPGEKLVLDKSGCCPVQKKICDTNTCPKLPSKCEEMFYELKVILQPGDCCPSATCNRPQGTCIALINGVKILKKAGDRWIKWQKVIDPCIQRYCTYSHDSSAVIYDFVQECNTDCPTGFEYKKFDATKCCGICVQAQCFTREEVPLN